MADKQNLVQDKSQKKTLVLAAGVVAVIILLSLIVELTTVVFNRLITKQTDIFFIYKESSKRRELEAGKVEITQNIKLSPDILIVGIESKSLSELGRWPLDRYHYSNFVNSLTRISDQSQRENSTFLDIFFIEPDQQATNDILVIDSFEENGRIFLETILSKNYAYSNIRDEMILRQNQLDLVQDQISNIQGDFTKLDIYYSEEAPLVPYSENIAGYGHANYYPDADKLYRRQQLLTRLASVIDRIELNSFTLDYNWEPESFQRLCWFDTDSELHVIDPPKNERELSKIIQEVEKNGLKRSRDLDDDGIADELFDELILYQDTIIPAITFSLALNYLNVDESDVEVVIGSHIKIPNPRVLNPENGQLEPYKILIQRAQSDGINITQEAKYKVLEEIDIPINDRGELLVNFMGPRSHSDSSGYQTFPVRPFYAYTQRVPGSDTDSWPATKALDNKIVMVGGFFAGMDEKNTPLGLMYGIEVHANALNTILMNNFIYYAKTWQNFLIMGVLLLVIGLISTKTHPGWSFLIMLLLMLILLYIANVVLFDKYNFVINYFMILIASIVCYIAVVITRTIVAQGDKKRIKTMFGKYVSPLVVDQMMMTNPELGGEDTDISIYFSDIRSFTTLSESLTPQELVELLNKYLTSMTDCLINFHGTLDKYIGDAIMAFWGAPLHIENHADYSCRCALKQMQLLTELNKTLPENKNIRIGIGINSGVATVGNMGSEGRMNYTVMGDNVNLASRLESINKQYGTKIIISEKTYNKLDKSMYIVRELDDIQVKGKNKPVRIYELIDYLGKIDDGIILGENIE